MPRRALSSGRIAASELPTMVDLYLEDLSRHPLLTVDEEVETARRARAGDERALEKLIRANLRFVVSVAKRYQNRGLPFADLVQEGNLGLVTAARKFDPEQGVKFISYAVWWIRQAILAALARHSRAVRLPLNRATELSRVQRVTELLKQELGRDPTPVEIARAASLRARTVELLAGLNSPAVRLDAPIGESEDGQLLERFLTDEADLEQETERRLLEERVAVALQRIRPRDARVLCLYYGLQGESEHTLEQIGQLLGVTRERVRQLRDRALLELRTGDTGSALYSFAIA